ncbi:MAG TPA: lysyl oxidase family protein, partial [Acidimicrobiia bacterium]|nr:lysyl oxidase family protein [Acidimicrobiia bacterium]
CDARLVDVAVPAGRWAAAPGGLLVAIEWPEMDVGYDLDLYVYRAGEHAPVASSTSTSFSRYEAAWVANPPAGRYMVVVAAKAVLGQPVAPDVLTPLRYEGAARLERGVTVDRAETEYGLAFTRRLVAFDQHGPDDTPLLPDLVPTTPSGFHLESGWGAQYYFYGDRGLRHPPSCYPQETASLTGDNPSPTVGPLRCLRWDQGESNVGDGPLELHNYPQEGSRTEMWQRVYRSDGTATQGRVGETRFSSNHGHLHYLGFTVVTLHRVAADGSVGAEVMRAPDKGICLVDVQPAALGGSRTSPLSYGVPGTCDTASHTDPHDPTYRGSPYFAMGISVGAADIYPWYLADQYLDVTNVADGRYLLRVEIDAGGKLAEKTRANNVAVTCVDLHGQQAAPCRSK